MPQININKKRNDPRGRIDLEKFWRDVPDLRHAKNQNLTGDWHQSFGKVHQRLQDIDNDLFIPLGRLRDGTYGSINLSLERNLLAVGSALSGLGVFRRAAYAHLERTKSPEKLLMVILDPLRAMPHVDGSPNLAIPRSVTKTEINAALEWLSLENERRIDICKAHQCLMDVHNREARAEDKEPHLVVLITELGELGIEDGRTHSVLMRVISMARASGIATVITTQQPSAEKIPDTLLAGIPARIACKLPYRNDSQRIIGKAGAENLLGQGDMIYTNRIQHWHIQGFYY